MKITLQEAEHRCKKCKTPLDFCNNYILNDKEFEKIKKKWWQTRPMRLVCLLLGVPGYKLAVSVDNKRQHWICPKCFERYLVDLR